MLERVSTATTILSLTTIAAVALCTPVQAQSASEQQDGPVNPRSVLDGVFTEAQAARGESVFGDVCTMCHRIREFTAGSHVPTAKFDNVGDMFMRIWTRMPMDDPGGLSLEEYIAVVTYILQQNGYPAGAEALPADVNKLREIRLEPISGDGS